jgi:hypothetical protein
MIVCTAKGLVARAHQQTHAVLQTYAVIVMIITILHAVIIQLVLPAQQPGA